MCYKEIQFEEIEKNFIGDNFNEVSKAYVEWTNVTYELIYNEHYVGNDLKHRLRVKVRYRVE